MSNKLNDDIFDVMLNKAFDKYSDYIASEEPPELSEEGQAIMENSKQRIYKNIEKQIKRENRKKNISARKILTLVALVAVIGTLLAANATAFKSFLLKTYTSMQGDNMKISTGYSEFDNKYHEITLFDKNNLVIPGWLPNNTNLIDIENENMFVSLRYEIGDKYLEFLESDISISGNGHMGGKGYTVQLKGNSYKESTIKVMDAEATIIKRKFESGLENYIISWSTDNTYYEIETDLSYRVILTILNELKYFE